MAKKLTKAKAREILHDKEVHDHPLTDKQRKFFGAVASGHGWLDKYENGEEAKRDATKVAPAIPKEFPTAYPRQTMSAWNPEESKRREIIRKGDEREDFINSLIAGADVATDIMQVGNFIPLPQAQVIGQIGNMLGSGIDAAQAYRDVKHENYGSAAANIASLALPIALSRRGYTRDMYNTEPGSMADKIASFGNRDGSYRHLTAFPHLANNPVIRKGINYNRSILGAIGAETVQDAQWNKQYENGGFAQGGEQVRPQILQQFEDYRTSPEGKDYFRMMEENRIAKKRSGRVDYSDIDPITDIALPMLSAPGVLKGLLSGAKNIAESKGSKKALNIATKEALGNVPPTATRSTPKFKTVEEAEKWGQKYQGQLNEDFVDRALANTYGSQHSLQSLRDRLTAGDNELDLYNKIYNAVQRESNNFKGWISDEARKKLPTNKSRLTKDEILTRLSEKDKPVVSGMTEDEFKDTVLKPDGTIAKYTPTEELSEIISPSMHQKGTIPMTHEEYADEFNKNIHLLNEIIARNNKSGVPYTVESLSPSGTLKFNSPHGPSEFYTGVKPGKWSGEVQDIANEEYFQSIPGLSMRNTTGTVFGDRVPRQGTGAYRSLNEYLKAIDLGRVKPGFNSQTKYSRSAWENVIKKGQGYGYYSDPSTVYGIMKAIPPVAIGVGAVATQRESVPTREFRNGGMQEYQENYNEPSVSYPPNFVGMSNNTQGFDYNSAWGGRWGNGGKAKAWNPELAKTDIEFLKWYDENTTEAKEGRPFNSPDSVYDFYSYYRNTPKEQLSNPEIHFPDTYKYPNHPTFSNESIYSTPEKPGGTWKGETFNPKGKFSFEMGGSIPGANGFQYARHGAPSEGKYAKKTLPSAQSGKMMSYYQQGLDFEPKTISADGSKIPSKAERLKRQAFAESAWREGDIRSRANALGPLQIMENAYQDYAKATGDKAPYESVQKFPKAIAVRNWIMDNIANAEFIKGKPQTEAAKLAKIYGSYNWGKTNMANYLNEQKSQGVDIYNNLGWVEGLPTETKDYIGKILLGKDPNFEKDFQKATKSNPNVKYFKKFAEGGALQLTKLDQLTNFTNYNKPARGGWLDNFK